MDHFQGWTCGKCNFNKLVERVRDALRLVSSLCVFHPLHNDYFVREFGSEIGFNGAKRKYKFVSWGQINHYFYYYGCAAIKLFFSTCSCFVWLSVRFVLKWVFSAISAIISVGILFRNRIIINKMFLTQCCNIVTKSHHFYWNVNNLVNTNLSSQK